MASFVFLRGLAGTVLVDQAPELGAIQRGKGSAGTGAVRGLVLGKAGVGTFQIAKPSHFLSKFFLPAHLFKITMLLFGPAPMA